MKSFDFSAPTRVFFGNGKLGVVVSEDRNRKDVDLDPQTRVFLTRKCDFASGFGGGSSMDSSKDVVSRADVVPMYRDSL
jgi:alcohol dehydrogenase YqhD (iron-dependent ADH family)